MPAPRTAALAAALSLLFAAPAAAQQPGLDAELPADPNVKIGTLDNGLRYYVRKNVRPENRAELRLVVNVGSVLEDDDQRGLAHFVEHMGFNGTKNFSKQELVDYLERIGMRFGPDVNAYTSFDETVYMLQIPTDSASIVDQAFQILEDWAHGQQFDAEEVEKERGVVIEEWRLGRGAMMRMLDQQLPILFRGSRYAERLPIGTKEVLDGFTRADAVRFYREWYRPELMAVVAVGDFDPAAIEAKIRTHFSRIQPVANPRERALYPVPDHEQPLFAIATDPEAPFNSVAVYFKQPVPEEESTVRAYRRGLMEQLYSGMLNTRFAELTQKADPPFLGAGTGKGRMIRTKDTYYLGAGAPDGGIARALDALLTEGERVDRHGFTASELEREKVKLLRRLQQAYDEREKTESRVYADEYVRNYLEHEPIPGIAAELQLAQALLPTIAVEELNRLASEWITERNRVVMVSAARKEGAAVPSEQELQAVFAGVDGKEIAAYVDAVVEEPLVANPPPPGRIAATRRIEELGVTEWRLSNGVTVVLKPTDFKQDEVMLRAFSPGGSSLVSDEQYVSAAMASGVVGVSGLGAFDMIALQKALAGKAVRVNSFIGTLEEGLFGSASPKDLETLFQLVHLHFTAPRLDSAAFQSFKQRVQASLTNRAKDPTSALQDTVSVTLAQYHPRARPPTPELYDELDLGTAMRVYRDRFADASDFTFVIAGAIDPDQLRPLVEQYVATLPANGREETWRDVDPDPPAGVIEKTVTKGIEPKSYTRMIFTGDAAYSRTDAYALGSLADVLRIRLREVLREDLGGTYGVSVGGGIQREPDQEYSFSIGFGSEPGRVQELFDAALGEVQKLKAEGPSADDIAKVKEIQRRERETRLKENGFWLGQLGNAYRYGEDPRQILAYDELVEALDAAMIQDAARKYLRMEQYVRVTLVPEVVP